MIIHLPGEGTPKSESAAIRYVKAASHRYERTRRRAMEALEFGASIKEIEEEREELLTRIEELTRRFVVVEWATRPESEQGRTGFKRAVKKSSGGHYNDVGRAVDRASAYHNHIWSLEETVAQEVSRRDIATQHMERHPQSILNAREEIEEIRSRMRQKDYSPRYMKTLRGRVRNLKEKIEELHGQLRNAPQEILLYTKKIASLKEIQAQTKVFDGERSEIDHLREEAVKAAEEWAALEQPLENAKALQRLQEVNREEANKVIDGASRVLRIERPEDTKVVNMATDVKVTGTYYNEVTFQTSMSIEVLGAHLEPILKAVKENSSRGGGDGEKDFEKERELEVVDWGTVWFDPQDLWEALKHLGANDSVRLVSSDLNTEFDAVIRTGNLRDFIRVAKGQRQGVEATTNESGALVFKGETDDGMRYVTSWVSQDEEPKATVTFK